MIARLNYTSASGASIILQNEAYVGNDGLAKFQTLGVNIAMSSLQIEYYLDRPVGVNATTFKPMNTVAPSIAASNPVLTCQVNEKNLVVTQATGFSLTVSLIDSLSANVVPNIAWNVR